MKNNRVITALFLLFPAVAALANEDQSIQMADTMRSNGKIYVVVAVLLTVLAGLFIYLWRLDRRVSQIEKNHRNS